MKRDEGREAFEKPHRLAQVYGNDARSFADTGRCEGREGLVTVTKWYGERSGHPKEKMTAKPSKDIAR
jgi:hypothetical protein